MFGHDGEALELLTDLSTSELRQRLDRRGFAPEDYEELLAQREDMFVAMRIATLLGMVKT
jgi:hypothetical protein